MSRERFIALGRSGWGCFCGEGLEGRLWFGGGERPLPHFLGIDCALRTGRSLKIRLLLEHWAVSVSICLQATYWKKPVHACLEQSADS